MIGWERPGFIALLSQEDLRNQLEKHLGDLDWIEVFEYLAYQRAVWNNELYMSRERHEEINAYFNNKLIESVNKGEIKISHEFGKTYAKKYLSDFLSIYKYRTKNIDCTFSDLPSSSDRVLNFSLKKDQNILQKLTKKLGDTYFEFAILESSIESLKGTAISFVLAASGHKYEFGNNEVQIIAPDEDW